MTIEPIDPIRGPMCWTGDALEASGDWAVAWPVGAVDEIDAALRHATAIGRAKADIRREDFPLPTLQPFLDGLLEELEDGKGLFRVTGFPVERYSTDELRSIFWGLGTHLGTALYQNARAEIIGEVRDESRDGGFVAEELDRQAANDAGAKGDQRVLASRARARSTGPLRFHTDRCDVIALFCVDDGIEGGTSKLVSAASVHNEMLRRRPDLLAHLYQPIHRLRPEDEWGVRDDQIFALPVFGAVDGKLTTQYSRTYVEQAQERAGESSGVPKLSAEQWQALDLWAELCEELHMAAPFQPGDMQLLNNHVVYHGRTAFADDQAAGKQRLLLRLWLSVANSRALPEGHEVVWGDIRAGAIRGGVTLEGAPDRRTPVIRAHG